MCGTFPLLPLSPLPQVSLVLGLGHRHHALSCRGLPSRHALSDPHHLSLIISLLVAPPPATPPPASSRVDLL